RAPEGPMAACFPRRRPRRLRTRVAVRDLVREHRLRPEDLIQPLFVRAGGGADEPIPSMPGQARLSEPRLVEEAARAWEAGVRAVALFPKVDDALKTLDGREAWNDEGLIPRVVRRLKA